MNEAEREALAFKLIDMTGWAIQRLYGGSLPAVWKDRVKIAFGLNKRGAPTQVGIQAGNRKIAFEGGYGYLLSRIMNASIPFDEKEYAAHLESLNDIYDRADINELRNIVKSGRAQSREEAFFAIRDLYKKIGVVYQIHGQTPPADILELLSVMGENRTIQTEFPYGLTLVRH